MIENTAAESSGLQVGLPFKPYGVFTGIFIPEALVKCKEISAGAKLTYGRLARYAGKDGRCFPAVATLAFEIGVSARQAQRYLAELERKKLIRRVGRISVKGQASNSYEFVWHALFTGGGDRSVTGGDDRFDVEGVTDLSPIRESVEESHSEEVKTDLDCPATNRKKRDSQPGRSLSSSQCRQYARLREALADYMVNDGDERIYPKDRHVVDVMDAADGATEDEVIQCLGFLREERGLKSDTKNGPRHFSWFPTVVGDHFRQRREREEAANPIGYQACGACQRF